MIARQARTATVGLLVAAATLGLWLGLTHDDAPAPRPHTAPSAITPAPPQERTTTPEGPTTARGAVPTAREALAVLDTPDDLDAAREVAAAFATHLYRSDLDALQPLTTPRLATTLLTSARTRPDDAGEVAVDGVITKDVQHDRVLAQVAVRRNDDGGRERLEVVTVSVVRTDGAWLIDDVAF